MAVKRVEQTYTFKKCAKRCKVSQDVLDKLEKTVYAFGFQVTQRSERIFVTEGRTAEAWDIRFGNPNRGKGTSGGYRVVMFFIVGEQTAYLDYIDDKDEVTKKHRKSEYEQNIVVLKKYLKENYPADSF